MPKVGVAVVTYHPDLTALVSMLEAYYPQLSQLVMVDNGSSEQILANIRIWVRDHPKAEILELKENLGIAEAQNRAVSKIFASGCEFVLLSDQDSYPANNLIENLLAGFSAPLSASANSQVAAVGPLVCDSRKSNAADTLAYTWQKWGPKRAPHSQLSNQYLKAAFLLASGCIISRDAWAEIGPMNSELFIDHVDLEWGLRANQQGKTLLVRTDTKISHSLGENSLKIPGRTQPIHTHSPIRCYYLSRNTIYLIKSSILPRTWKIGYMLWIGKFSVFNALLVPPRLSRIRYLGLGILHGLQNRLGPFAK